MTTVTIALDKNPEIKDLVADKQPGDKIVLRTAIKFVDGQTLVLTVEDAEEGDGESADEEAAEPTAADQPDAAAAPNPLLGG